MGMMTSMREPESAYQRTALVDEDRPVTFEMPVHHICQFELFGTDYGRKPRPVLNSAHVIPILEYLAKKGCLDWADEHTSTRSLLSFIGNWMFDSAEWKCGPDGNLYAVVLNDNRPEVTTFQDFESGYLRIGFAWKTPVWPIISTLLSKASWSSLCRPAFSLDADILADSKMEEMDLEDAIKSGKEDLAEEIREEIAGRDREDWRQSWYKEACRSFYASRKQDMRSLVQEFRDQSALAADLESFLSEAIQLADEIDAYERKTKRMFTKAEWQYFYTVEEEASVDGFMFPIHWGQNDDRLTEHIDQIERDQYNNYGSVIAHAKRWIDKKGRLFEKSNIDQYPIKQHLRLRLCSWNERLYDHLHPKK